MCFSLCGDHRYLHALTHSFPTRRSSYLKRHIAFPAVIVEMRSRVVLALRPARNLDHDLRGTADNASKPRPRAPALACPPRTQRAQQHIGPAPVRVAGQLWFEQRGKLSRLKAAIKVAHWKPPNRTGQLS